MAQGNIEIQYTPKGDKELIGALKQLDVVTKRLQGTTSVYEQGAKKQQILKKNYYIRFKMQALHIKN